MTLVLAVAGVDGAVVSQKNFLGNGMQPEVVARTLSHVEDEWKAQAAVFTECKDTAGMPGATIVNCNDAPSSFSKSCGTVVGAIIQGSGGDKDVAKEYMGDVCTQRAISGWHQTQCNALAAAVQGAMSADKYENRENFNTAKLCTSFWSRFLTEEQQRVAKEKAEREAAEKKAAEEAAEKEKQHQEEMKKEAERKKVEEAERKKKEDEAKAAEAAAEAKAKAAEAAERAAQKKAEAEETAKAAQKKIAEAEAAEAEHKQAAAKVPEAPKPAAKEAPKPAAKEAPKEQKVKAPVVKPAKAEAVALKVAKPAPAKAEKPATAKPAAPKAAAQKK